MSSTTENPTFTNETERLVWEKVTRSLDPDELVVANMRLTGDTKDHEIDLLILMPDSEIVVVEVKGGSVSIEDGRWLQGGRTERHEIHPVDQALEGKYAIHRYRRRLRDAELSPVGHPRTQRHEPVDGEGTCYVRFSKRLANGCQTRTMLP